MPFGCPGSDLGLVPSRGLGPFGGHLGDGAAAGADEWELVALLHVHLPGKMPHPSPLVSTEGIGFWYK